MRTAAGTEVLLPSLAAAFRLVIKEGPAMTLSRGDMVRGFFVVLAQFAACVSQTTVVSGLILVISTALAFLYLWVTVRRILRHATHRK